MIPTSVETALTPAKHVHTYLRQLLKGYSGQYEIHSINLHMYTILVVPSNCAQRSLINNKL